MLVVPVSEFQDAGSDWDSLELIADSPEPPTATVEPAFFLRLPSVTEGLNDDLGQVLKWLEWSKLGGCQKILCGAPFSEDKGYRHRWLTLVRGLCEEYKLDFVILERPETPTGWLLNRFLATRKVCCRAAGTGS